jgi:hypothetical protein
MKLTARIDRFAEMLRARGIAIERTDATPWIDRFLRQLPSRLPRSYEHLVAHYRFVHFELSEIDFYSNLGDGAMGDLVVAATADRNLASVCFANHLVPIGRPADGSYDPICFFLREGRRETPLVRIDHERALMDGRVVIVARTADSFFDLIEEVISGERQGTLVDE